MWMTKLKVAAAVVLGVSLVTAGAGHLSIATGQGPSGPPATKTAATGRANPAVPALIQALKDPSPEVRASAASILARLGTDAREAIPALVAVLKDNDSKVRAQAVEALGALAREKEKPAEPAPDIIFIRRTHLDATGTPPTPAEVQKFLADTSPDKRAKLVDSLLRPNHEWLDFGGIGDEQRLLFAPNGETLAIARRHEVTLVNARTGEEKRSLSVPDRIASAAFSPDARLLVIASSNHKVRAYDANTGKLVWQREAPATDRPSGR